MASKSCRVAALYRWLIATVLGSLAYLGGLPAGADPPPSWPAELSCQWGAFQLQCRFRPLGPVTIHKIELLVDDGKPQAVDDWQPFIRSGDTSAIVWLVDVSNPARSNTVARQIELLRKWLTGMEVYHRVGLAAFANGAANLAPVGSAPETLARALDGLAARGHSTAYYRSLLDGVTLLKAVEAKRKSLWVFSDGLAEDTAYSHEDVVAAARAAGVMIVGLGYPERESQQTDLQRLQRLAEETGGYFAAAPVRGSLALGTLANVLAVIDGGGSFKLDLPELYGSHRLRVRLISANGGSFEKDFTVEGPPLPAGPAVEAPSAHRASQSRWGWLAAGAGMLSLLAGLGLWRRRRRADRPVLARLELIGSNPAGEFTVRARVARIGRALDNDLRLENDSVSAYHAELRQGREGMFSIIDLGSSNGVWVNGEPVSCHGLRDGDVFELGEVRLRFRQAG